MYCSGGDKYYVSNYINLIENEDYNKCKGVKVMLFWEYLIGGFEFVREVREDCLRKWSLNWYFIDEEKLIGWRVE